MPMNLPTWCWDIRHFCLMRMTVTASLSFPFPWTPGPEWRWWDWAELLTVGSRTPSLSHGRCLWAVGKSQTRCSSPSTPYAGACSSWETLRICKQKRVGKTSRMGATCSACTTGHSPFAGTAVVVRVRQDDSFQLRHKPFWPDELPRSPLSPASLPWWFPASGMPSSGVRSSAQAETRSVSGFTLAAWREKQRCCGQSNPDAGQLNSWSSQKLVRRQTAKAVATAEPPARRLWELSSLFPPKQHCTLHCCLLPAPRRPWAPSAPPTCLFAPTPDGLAAKEGAWAFADFPTLLSERGRVFSLLGSWDCSIPAHRRNWHPYGSCSPAPSSLAHCPAQSLQVGCLCKPVPSSSKSQVLFFQWREKKKDLTKQHLHAQQRYCFHPVSRSLDAVLAIKVCRLLHYQENFFFVLQKTFQELPLKPFLRSGTAASCNLSMSACSTLWKPLHWILWQTPALCSLVYTW